MAIPVLTPEDGKAFDRALNEVADLASKSLIHTTCFCTTETTRVGARGLGATMTWSVRRRGLLTMVRGLVCSMHCARRWNRWR